MRLNNYLFKQIDNSALIVFRMIFGALIFMESVGAILTGWVKRTMIEPEFTFSFIGLEWLQPLPGHGMYIYYLVMGVFSLMVMFGFKYRFAMFSYTLLWAGTYFMQKASYNNHYYLLILICTIMTILPAHRAYSVDSRRNAALRSNAMPQWCRVVIILQLFIVYTYASVAKIYPDWLDLTVAKNLMAARKDYYLIGDILQQEWFHHFIAYAGILFDLLVVPFLLWKRTRNFAFFASIFFHLFNSIVFQIGIFPYLSLAFILFFYEPKTVQRLFLKGKEFYHEGKVIVPSYDKVLVFLFAVYFVVQVALPVRHWFIKDDVLWTEEGHRLSWRMMLRSKSGITKFRVIDKATGKATNVNLKDYLTPKQRRIASTKPDVIWQFAQRLKRLHAEKGQDVSVFVDAKVSVNGRPFKQLIDTSVDLASVKWNAFGHNEWILPSE